MPTDPRLDRLTDEQTSVLFQYWLDYDEDIARKMYREKRATEVTKPAFDGEELRSLGYSEQEIEKIVRSFE